MRNSAAADQALFSDAGLRLYLESEECKEGQLAFAEKRKPDFASLAYGKR